MAIKKEKTEEVVATPVVEVPAVETPVAPIAPVVDDSQGIVVNSPMDIRPTELPLVITLPPDASAAQVKYVKTLNVYAYQNKAKWDEKKDDRIVNGVLVKGLITKLKELKNAPDPVEGNLKINKSSI